MNKYNLHSIVYKIIGPIDPIGDSIIDSQRCKNLKDLIVLVDKLLSDIDYIAYSCKDAPQDSKARAAKIASDFFDRLEIQE